MKTILLVSGLFVNIFAQQNQLPLFMLGEFKLDTSEGFSDFMKQVGVSWITRQVKYINMYARC